MQTQIVKKVRNGFARSGGRKIVYKNGETELSLDKLYARNMKLSFQR